MTARTLHLVESVNPSGSLSLRCGDMDAALAAAAVRTLAVHGIHTHDTTLIGDQTGIERLNTLGLPALQVGARPRPTHLQGVVEWSALTDVPCWTGDVPSPLSRTDLGISGEPLVVALCADPPTAADARRFVFLIALLEALGREVVGLIPSMAWNVARAARFARNAGPQWKLRLLDAPLAACWNAIDLGVVMTAPWTLDHDQALLEQRQKHLIASAHASGKIVLWSGPNPPAHLYPPDLMASLTCPTDEARRLAQQAIVLLEDPVQLASLGSRVREHTVLQYGGAFEAWVRERWGDQHEEGVRD